MKENIVLSHFARFFYIACLAFIVSITAHAESYDEGIEYIKISPAVSTSTGKGQVEVVELFWYMCPHCYRFEPVIQKWLKNKPKNVVFKRIPAIISPRWRFFAKVFYTLQILDVEEKVHQPLFEALHEQKARLGNEAAIARFVAKHAGVKKQEFSDVFNSFSVDAKVRKAEDLTKRYGTQGVPTLVVNGKWRTGGTIAGGHKGMIKVAEHLIKLESKR